MKSIAKELNEISGGNSLRIDQAVEDFKRYLDNLKPSGSGFKFHILTEDEWDDGYARPNVDPETFEDISSTIFLRPGEDAYADYEEWIYIKDRSRHWERFGSANFLDTIRFGDDESYTKIGGNVIEMFDDDLYATYRVDTIQLPQSGQFQIGNAVFDEQTMQALLALLD